MADKEQQDRRSQYGNELRAALIGLHGLMGCDGTYTSFKRWARIAEMNNIALSFISFPLRVYEC